MRNEGPAGADGKVQVSAPLVVRFICLPSSVDSGGVPCFCFVFFPQIKGVVLSKKNIC